MADYYSHNDPRKKGNDQYLDYDTGSGAKWIWAGIVLVAIVALLSLGSFGTDVAPDRTAPAALEAPNLDAPAATVPTE